jgi:hypothetical protein
VDGHQLDSTIAAGFRVRLCGKGLEGCVERGAEQVLFAIGEAVESLPKKVEVGEGGGIDALSAAQAQPDLLEPGAESGGWLSETQGGYDGEDFEDALGGLSAFEAEKLKALC